MGSDQNIHLALCQPLKEFTSLFRLGGPGQYADARSVFGLAEEFGKSAVMLSCQHLGRRHQRSLEAGMPNSIEGRGSDRCLSGADIALYQAVHNTARHKIL